jgi:acetyl-CoA acetyltransferase
MTAHAAEVAERYGRTRADIAAIVIENHEGRLRNPGAGAWRVSARGTTVIYDWPDHGDAGTARVITLWPAR